MRVSVIFRVFRHPAGPRARVGLKLVAGMAFAVDRHIKEGPRDLIKAMVRPRPGLAAHPVTRADRRDRLIGRERACLYRSTMRFRLRCLRVLIDQAVEDLPAADGYRSEVNNRG